MNLLRNLWVYDFIDKRNSSAGAILGFSSVTPPCRAQTLVFDSNALMTERISSPPPNKLNFLRLRLQPEFGRMPVAEMPLICVFWVAGGGSSLCNRVFGDGIWSLSLSFSSLHDLVPLHGNPYNSLVMNTEIDEIKFRRIFWRNLWKILASN